MRKLFILLLSALALTAVAQQKKTVAVLDPICRDNSVNVFFQQMVRGAMESAVTTSNEYDAYDRSAFDQIQKEQAFQRTGAVSDSQIKKMGEMAGVDYVLVSEVSAYDGYLSAIVKILNVTTGKYDKSNDDIMELKPEAVKVKCKEMAKSLFGSIQKNKSQTNDKSSSDFVITKKLLTERGFVFSPLSRQENATIVTQVNTSEGAKLERIKVICSDSKYYDAGTFYGGNLKNGIINGLVYLKHGKKTYLMYIFENEIVYPLIECYRIDDGYAICIQTENCSFGCMFPSWNGENKYHKIECGEVSNLFGEDIESYTFRSKVFSMKIPIESLEQQFIDFLRNGKSINVNCKFDNEY